MEEPKPAEAPKEASELKEKTKTDAPKKKAKKAAKPKDADKDKDTPKEAPSADASKEGTTVDAAKENIDGSQQNLPDAPQETASTEPKIDPQQQNGENVPKDVPMETETTDESKEDAKPQENVTVVAPQEDTTTEIPRKDSKVDLPLQITPTSVPVENLGTDVQQNNDPNFNVVVETTKTGPPKVTSSFQVIPSDPEQLRLEEELRKKKMEDEDWLKDDAGDAAPEATEEVPAEGAPALLQEGIEEEDNEPPKRRVRSDRPLIFKYWKRPVFLQYAYLYDYRHNYYDDVMDYLDKRQRGIFRDIPRAQTWAERALRTYNAKSKHTADYEKRERDISLLSDMRTSNRFYKYHHSKEYFTTKYSSIM